MHGQNHIKHIRIFKLMLSMEINAISSENHTKHANVNRGQKI